MSCSIKQIVITYMLILLIGFCSFLLTPDAIVYPPSLKNLILQEYYAAAQNGQSFRDVARRFGIPHTTLYEWHIHFQTYGSVESKAVITGIESRGRPRALDRTDILVLINAIADDTTLYNDELNDLLYDTTGADVDDETVRISLERLGYTRKKISKF